MLNHRQERLINALCFRVYISPGYAVFFNQFAVGEACAECIGMEQSAP